MFGHAKPVIFDPYARRRGRRLMPRWLVLLLLGVALGAGAVLFVQERYLPPRLSASESAELRTAFENTDAERAQLAVRVADTARQLERVTGERTRLVAELGEHTQSAERLREDVAALVASLPPDPRNGPVAVRAARFAFEDGALAYDVVLSRERAGSQPLGGVLQFVVAGASGRGTADKVALQPLPVSLKSYDSLRGTLPLPEGFRPRQTTVQVLDKVGGRLLGMRVILVK